MTACLLLSLQYVKMRSNMKMTFESRSAIASGVLKLSYSGPEQFYQSVRSVQTTRKLGFEGCMISNGPYRRFPLPELGIPQSLLLYPCPWHENPTSLSLSPQNKGLAIYALA